jgi:hypothetical protein
MGNPIYEITNGPVCMRASSACERESSIFPGCFFFFWRVPCSLERRLVASIGSSANLGMASLRVRIALVLVFCDVILCFHISTPVPGRTQVSCPALLDETRGRMKSRSGPTARRQSFLISARRLPSSEASAFDHPPQLQMCVYVCVCRALHFLRSCASVSLVV